MDAEVSPRTERREKEQQAHVELDKLFALTRDRHWYGRISILVDIEAGRIKLITPIHAATLK